MIYAALLAGGKGSRMEKKGLPKQFLMLREYPVIVHTAKKFLGNQRIGGLIVAVPSEWTGYTSELFEKHFSGLCNIHVIQGGADRNRSLKNVCDYIHAHFEVNERDILITHDAVRPFVTGRIINENIDAALEYGFASTAIPAVDTIIVSEDKSTVSSIPKREVMYQCQTPQTFKISEFMNVFGSLTETELEGLTDASKIYVLKGKPVKLVMGETFNFKITTGQDLKIAKFLSASL